MFWRRRKLNDLDSEIQSHLQLESDDLRKQGLSEKEARLAAQRKFGNVTRLEERFYEESRWHWADTLWQNIRFGLRMMARNPGSSAVVVLVLALGIGANTAIFTLLNAVLLRDLPVHNPGELVLFGKGLGAGSTSSLPNRSTQLFSNSFFRDFSGKNEVFSHVAAIDSLTFTTHGRIAGGSGLEPVQVELVSGSYFETLGLKPAAGRLLMESDDAEPGAHPVAVASHSWWERRLAVSGSGTGTTVAIGGVIYRVVGIAPPEFGGITVGQSPDLWIPLAMEKEISPGWNGLDDNMFQSLYIFARLKNGVGEPRAGANTNLLFQQAIHAYAGPQPTKEQLQDLSHAKIDLTPLAKGMSFLRHQFSSPLLILMALVATVLLIACTNVANLLMARATARQHEFAIRMSIGASRRQLIGQLFAECSLLGLLGGVLGIGVAWAGSRALLAMVSSGPELLPLDITPDLPVLGFALAVSIIAVLLFGMLPAFRATSPDLTSPLKENRGVTGIAGKSRLTRGLIVGQVALSLALLSGAGLFLRSLSNLMNVDSGFDRHNVLLTSLDTEAAGYQKSPRLRNTLLHIEEQIGAIPGVRAAAIAFVFFNQGEWTGSITPTGRHNSGHEPEVSHNIVGAQYLNAMGTPIILGRGLSAEDTATSRKVAVINETAARTYFPDISPLGRTFSVQDVPEWRDVEVVGVAKDAKYMDLKESRRAAGFYPLSQHDGFFSNVVIRYRGDPKVLIPQIRKAVGQVDPNIPVGEFSTLEHVVGDSVAQQRLLAQLSALFGGLAALLACVGIYGVMSYGVARRTNEFGMRVALGANRRSLLGMVFRETLLLAFAGAMGGITLAFAAGRLLEGMLFGLRATDPGVIGLAAALMIGVALLAGWIPARRATRIDPMAALRHD